LFTRKNLIGFTKIALLVGVVIVGNRLVQTHLGERAIEQTGLEILSLPTALAQAQKTNRLVLVDMSAVYCPTCRKLDNEIFANKMVQEKINQSFVYARIEYDSDAGDGFMQKYQVRGFPTVLILDQTGKKIAHLPLTFDPSQYKDNLVKVVQSFSGPNS
jgi:thioredoxin-related protein